MKITILTTRTPQAKVMVEAIRKHYPDTQLVVSRVLRFGHSELENILFGLKNVSIPFAISKLFNVAVTKYDNVSFESSNINKDLCRIREFNPDLIVSVYFNHFISAEVTKLAKYGGINLHPSLLPGYRGLFPYFWVLLNGEEDTGVTVHYVVPKLDAGDIIKQEVVPIMPDDTPAALNNRCSKIGKQLYLDAIRDIEQGVVSPVPQNGGEASYYTWFSTTDHLRLWWRIWRRRLSRFLRAKNK